MKFARFLLWLNGIFLVGYGVACFAFPSTIAADVIGYGLPTTTTFTEFRAMYGGLEFGLGVLFLLAVMRDGLLETGILVSLACFGGLALTRLGGLVIDGDPSAYTWVAVVYEWMTAIMMFIAYREFKGDSPSPA